MTGHAESADSIDRRILDLMESNSRTSITALARAIGLSRSATIERLRRLERDGVILGYSARIARRTAHDAHCWFVLKLEKGVVCKTVALKLARIPHLRTCHSVAGDWDILAEVNCPSPMQVAEMRDDLLRIDGVAEVFVLPILVDHLACGQDKVR